jgi:hypothetical protein
MARPNSTEPKDGAEPAAKLRQVIFNAFDSARRTSSETDLKKEMPAEPEMAISCLRFQDGIQGIRTGVLVPSRLSVRTLCIARSWG